MNEPDEIQAENEQVTAEEWRAATRFLSKLSIVEPEGLPEDDE